MKKLPGLLALLLFFACNRHTQNLTEMPFFKIPFEKNTNQTLTYSETMDCYETLAKKFPKVFHLETAGSTDIGEPLHVAVLDLDGDFSPEKIRRSGKRILLINNGIHPGEPEGIDATVMLIRDILEHPERQLVLKNLAIVFIPIYNVDGCLNRNSHSRANQDGPESYGFRGNARNYDLNRDFVKTDSRNARSFNQIFTRWSPDVFVDNHTSNGADYQYTMTLIATQHNKLEAPLGEFLQTTMLPFLYSEMKNRKWEMIPYVDGFDPEGKPDGGIAGFSDNARYSTGYAALWNTIGFMPETHMLKPFADRVWSTYHFMETVIKFIHENDRELAAARAAAFEKTRSKNQFVLDWKLDTSKRDSLIFKGFAAKYKPSEVSGLPRLYYDRNEPYEKTIPYFNYFEPSLEVEKPTAYLVPQAWENVVSRLELNGVKMEKLKRDTTFEVEIYFIKDFKNRAAWEGHYFHHSVKVEKKTMQRIFKKGDFFVPTDQNANRYILETLEPQAPDSFFAWNFFDPILMQKEYFSGYVFEDSAADFLKENPKVREELEAKKKSDIEFAGNAQAQLDWVYRQSPFYEPTHNLYPVARVVSKK